MLPKGSQFSVFSHCHAIQEMGDKSLLVTQQGEVWVGKEGFACEGTMFCM